MACTLFVDHVLTRQAILKDREIMSTYLNAVGNSLSAVMNQRLQLTYSLIAYVKAQPKITEEGFLQFANAAIGDAKGIMSLQLAPDGIVKFVTNKKDNAKAIGHDLLSDPKSRPLVEKAIRERLYVIAGPIDLIQGGRAIIARNPIFRTKLDGSDYFWGFATILLDVDAILEKPISIHHQSTINLAIRGKNALGAEGDIFYGEAAVFENNPVVEDVVLPSGSWQIGAARPDDTPGLLKIKIIVWLIGIVFAAVSAWLIRQILREPEILGNAIQIATSDLRIAKIETEKLLIQAEKANKAKSTFLTNMSHEIRTPMNAILGYSQILLRKKGLDKGTKDAIQTIDKSGKSLLKMINEILDISKIEAGKMELNPVNFDLNELIDYLSNMFKFRCQVKKLQWIVKGFSTPVPVRGDETKLLQILINLLGNAIKFTESGRVSFIATALGNNQYRFDIIDTGHGIPIESREKIFEAFHQEEMGAKHGGTGLGLAISKKQLQLMESDLLLNSECTEGAHFHFTVTLPASKEDVTKREVKTDTILRLDSGQSVKALVVDDVKENRDVLLLLLSEIGIETIEAENGKEGFEKTKEYHPDIVFMDMRMPIMRGEEGMKLIKKEFSNNEVKVVAITASALNRKPEYYLDMGFNEYISKPFNIDEVFNCLNKLLDVTFVYEEGDVSQDESPMTKELDLSKSSISVELYSKLKQAADQNNITTLEQLFKELSQKDEISSELVEYLRALMNQYDMESILEVLENIPKRKN